MSFTSFPQGKPASCYILGNESLAVQCAEILLAHGHSVRGVVTKDAGIIEWAATKSIPVIAPGPG